MRKLLFAFFSLVLLVVPNLLIWQKEAQKSASEIVYLRLAPVDPRSLIQGDYMALDYQVARNLSFHARKGLPRIGFFVVSIDAQKVAQFRRLAKSDEKLSSQERLLKYKLVKQNFRVGPNAFFFQEGMAPIFEKAVFGEIYLSKHGDVILSGMRDKDFKLLGRPKHTE